MPVGAPRMPLTSRKVLPDESVMAQGEERFEHWHLITARLDGERGFSMSADPGSATMVHTTAGDSPVGPTLCGRT